MGLTREVIIKGWVQTALVAERSQNVYKILVGKKKKKKVVD